MVQVGVVVMFSITRTTYNAVSVHGSRRPCYNGAAVYMSKITISQFTIPRLDKVTRARYVGHGHKMIPQLLESLLGRKLVTFKIAFTSLL